MDWSIDSERITIDTTEISAPYPVRSHVVLDNVLVAQLKSFYSGTTPEADFELPSDARNIVAFDRTGEIRWFVEAPPAGANDYDSVFEVDSRLVAIDSEDRLAELDLATGRIEACWPRGHFPFGETIVELDGPVQKIIELGGRLYIRCRESDTTLYGFTIDGKELWHSTGRRGMIFKKEGEILERVKHGPRRSTWYRLNLETGEREGEVDSPL